MRNKSTFKRLPSPRPYIRRITTTTVVAPGLGAFLIPYFVCSLFTVIGYYYYTGVVPVCPNGVPDTVYTLQQHKDYLEILEMIRRTWLANIDFIRGFELVDRATFIASNPQGEAYYRSMENAYQFIITRMNQGLNLQAIVHDFNILTQDLQDAIVLEDPFYVNP